MALALVVTLQAGVPLVAPAPAAAQEPSRPDVVVILTDDQRWDTLWAMPEVRRRLARHGVTYTQAFVPTALCCPSRASLLSGLFAHHHGVWRNAPPRGGFATFDDADTLATRLRDAGYTTAYFGKYLNRYDGSRVPPGWDRWFAFFALDRHSFYFDYDVSYSGVPIHFGSAEADYSTDVLATQAVEFLSSVPPGEPLFMVIAPSAPHGPAVPAPRHQGRFGTWVPPRPRSFNEADVSDKPRYIRQLPFRREERVLDFQRRQLESLLAVDELVGRVVDALKATGRLWNVLLVFTSDNGMMWGEHRLHGKSVPYEAATHVPLVIRWDAGGLDRGAIDDRLVAANVDVAASVLEAAGLPIDGLDGRPVWGAPRRAVLLEAIWDQIFDGRPRPAYCGVRTRGRLYVRYASGFEELYRYRVDRHEMGNAAATVPPEVLRRLRRMARARCGVVVAG